MNPARPAGVRARLERSFRVAQSGGDDTIRLRFEWLGGPAPLIELRDNETFVHIADPVGPWVYHAAPDNSHFIEWHLFAPGRELTKLKAFASLNGQVEQQIAADEKSDGGWVKGGLLR